jgi:hypothetical protein
MPPPDPPRPPLEPPDADLALVSSLTCPECGAKATETMPTDACWYFYDCAGCGALLKPRPGQCCVFCSYGAVPCPPMQASARRLNPQA